MVRFHGADVSRVREWRCSLAAFGTWRLAFLAAHLQLTLWQEFADSCQEPAPKSTGRPCARPFRRLLDGASTSSAPLRVRLLQKESSPNEQGDCLETESVEDETGKWSRKLARKGQSNASQPPQSRKRSGTRQPRAQLAEPRASEPRSRKSSTPMAEKPARLPREARLAARAEVRTTHILAEARERFRAKKQRAAARRGHDLTPLEQLRATRGHDAPGLSKPGPLAREFAQTGPVAPEFTKALERFRAMLGSTPDSPELSPPPTPVSVESSGRPAVRQVKDCAGSAQAQSPMNLGRKARAEARAAIRTGHILTEARDRWRRKQQSQLVKRAEKLRRMPHLHRAVAASEPIVNPLTRDRSSLGTAPDAPPVRAWLGPAELDAKNYLDSFAILPRTEGGFGFEAQKPADHEAGTISNQSTPVDIEFGAEGDDVSMCSM